MIPTYVTGFPRIGKKRELKSALEAFWAHKFPFHEVQNLAKSLRQKHWQYQSNSHINYIACNDFSYYDNMLDTMVMLGAIPKRFCDILDPVERYFAMARGDTTHQAMEMTKWFNTNYHYIVPELSMAMDLHVDISKITNEYVEAKNLGITPKINLIGPLTFLALSTCEGNDNFAYFDAILEAYATVFKQLSALDSHLIIQCDESFLAKTPEPKQLSLLKIAYEKLGHIAPHIDIAVVTYFDHAKEAVEILGNCPIWAIGLDFVYGEENLEALCYIQGKKLIAGLIDGRNVWKNNALKTASLITRIGEVIPKDQLIFSTSCSLLHLPYSIQEETKLDTCIKEKLSFAVEKLHELSELSHFFEAPIAYSEPVCTQPSSTSKPKLTHYTRSAYKTRESLQTKVLNLPLFPTTTIGSFPQTKEIRSLRSAFKRGELSAEAYEKAIQNAIKACVAFQEEIGLDVLVHGEFERNDMVEYFGEQLEGFAFSENGWVQSYGSRCVKPPLLYGSVSRKHPMTVEWITYAQSLSDKPMKGMLTGPVTILNWSFVRDDIPKSEVAYEVAQAIADEIDDLQRHDIKIIQVDEAAFKEGYPLRVEKIKAYEKWAVDSFKMAVNSAWDQTQIHTHMCYSNFNDIIHTIEQMDADVITIETSRSGNKLLKVFQKVGYKAQIGPGVYDIHSPRVPSVEEMREQIEAFLHVLPKEQLWINPDCGLKTRGQEEVKASLKNMIEAVHSFR
ncbi:MAG: 5-methyltetrahydropteroyltriglutamate--homocysteine S-methyltransferase [Sulfurospirillaceae bacterium]|nr:5-methyltetrahydropteroyltriglutamate--homocysteine S-methyltransferase [Sulfurospirillaceae bacterium]